MPKYKNLFADYFYDKEKSKNKKEEDDTNNDAKKAHTVHEQNEGSIGTTKFTTVITHLNN